MNAHFLSSTCSVGFSFSSVLNWLLLVQLGWRLLGRVRGSTLCNATCFDFLLTHKFKYWSCLCYAQRKREQGRQKNPNHPNQAPALPFKKQHKLIYKLAHISPIQTMNIIHRLTQVKIFPAASKPCFHLFLLPTTTFIWYEAPFDANP